METQNSHSERLLVLKGGYRRQAKNANRLDRMQVSGVDVNFIRVFTWKSGVLFHVFLRIKRQLLRWRPKAPGKTRMFLTNHIFIR